MGTGSRGHKSEAGHPVSLGESGALVPLSSIFVSFFKIGAFTFGGGWAMVPLIRKELVSRKKWLEDEEFLDMVAVAQSSPGPIAINTSVITGYKMRRFSGAVVAMLGSALPSFLVILALAGLLMKFKTMPVIEAAFKGMRPVIFGLLVSAVWQAGKSTIRSREDVTIVLVAVVLLLGVQLNPILVVLAGAVVGTARGMRRRRGQKTDPKEVAGEDSGGDRR